MPHLTSSQQLRGRPARGSQMLSGPAATIEPMTITYGEQMLHQAEARAARKTARKRRTTLLAPAAAATLWALADNLAARNARLDAIGAGAFRHIVDNALPLLWVLLFVMLPLMAALKLEPLPLGAALALVAGPIMSPLLFGPGGWNWWQKTVVVLVCALVLTAANARRNESRA